MGEVRGDVGKGEGREMWGIKSVLHGIFDYVAKLLSNSKSPIKFFTATGNLKSCFGVGNVNFRCMKVWRSYHVAKLLWQSYHVAKLLATADLTLPMTALKFIT